MNDTQRKAIMIAALRQAANGQPVPNGHHIAEDEETLLRWTEGDLSPAEHQALLDHLADCPSCRREIAAMVKAEALVLPEVDEASGAETHVEHTKTEDASRHSQKTTAAGRPARSALRYLWGALAAAAAILIAATLWTASDDGLRGELARAERELQAGNAAEAIRLSEQLLQGDLSAEERKAAAELHERSAYQAASKSLAAGEFRDVVDIQHRVDPEGTKSARLTNLRLQAERGVLAENSLDDTLQALETAESAALKPSIGGDGSKGLFLSVDPQERLEGQFRRAIEAHPADATLRVNFGHLLLESDRPEEAAKQFAAAGDLEPKNTSALLGLGLAALASGEPDEALTHIEAALRHQPNDPKLLLTAGLALDRAGRTEEAQNRLKEAAQRAKNPALIERIQSLLNGED